MKTPKWFIRPKYNEPKLTIYSESGRSSQMTFADDVSRDIATKLFDTLYQENNRLQKELDYKDELLQTVLEDLDDACNEVVNLQEVKL